MTASLTIAWHEANGKCRMHGEADHDGYDESGNNNDS